MEQGIPDLYPCLEVLAAPELAHNYKVAPVVTECRAAAGGLTANFGTVISVKVTSGPLSFCQLTESCVASCGQYRSHLSVQVLLLKQGHKKIRIKKMCYCVG